MDDSLGKGGRNRPSSVDMLRLPRSVASLLLAGLLLPGCGRDNGMSLDLMLHLNASGIYIQQSRVHAPLSERAGFLVTQYDARVAARIIDTFALEKLPTDDARWLSDTGRMRGQVVAKDVWGAWGRPPKFALKNGGQFEYFYLVVTPAGEMYLFAEYAFG
jgi:hypothetical protein